MNSESEARGFILTFFMLMIFMAHALSAHTVIDRLYIFPILVVLLFVHHICWSELDASRSRR